VDLMFHTRHNLIAEAACHDGAIEPMKSFVTCSLLLCSSHLWEEYMKVLGIDRDSCTLMVLPQSGRLILHLEFREWPGVVAESASLRKDSWMPRYT
jgi:hypothetical protein